MNDDTISRKAAIDEIRQYLDPSNERTVGGVCYNDGLDMAISVLSTLPSAQQWIPIKTRPMDEHERHEWSEKLGYDINNEEAVVYMPPLPEDGEEVLVCTRYRHVYIDTFCVDEGCYFEENGEMDGIIAWMPPPEPYREEQK